jgi:hypothetical protein
MCTDAENTRQNPKKILWQGPLFGRLTKSAKYHLIHRKGWVEQRSFADRKDNQQARLALIWPNKSGPQFAMDDSRAALVRPYPKSITDVLDDMVQLADLLRNSDIMPKYILSVNDASPDKLYFVKHRLGAQGKSVYVMNRTELREWWGQTNNAHEFVVQEEVVPKLYQSRKFFLRSHILLWHSSEKVGQDERKRTSSIHFHHHLFEEVIVQHHAALYYDHNSKASQISNVGKNQPSPMLLNDLPGHHPAASVYPQLVDASTHLVTVFETWFNQQLAETGQALDEHARATTIAPDTTCFALLGLDWLLQDNFHEKINDGDKIDSSPQIKLCEINSHPALGWGTMSKVPPQVFTNLVEQTLDLLIDSRDQN